MPKVMVGSVFCDHPRSSEWYRLQIAALQRTTYFSHVVYSQDGGDFKKSLVLPIQERGPYIPDPEIPYRQHGSENHVFGLNIILDYFRGTDSEYFLILDSDCFPVINNWCDKLIRSMGKFNVAAAVRYENLEVHAHPSAFFFKRSALDNLSFKIRKMTTITGDNYWDTAANVDAFFPMVRTNNTNWHRLLYGVYWDLFYHHGAGSRNMCFRSYASGYYDNSKPHDEIESKVYESLIKSPQTVIDKLIGSRPFITLL